MSSTFSEVVEEIKHLSYEEKQELELLIKKFLIEERREEIFQNYQIDKKKNDKNIYTDSSDLLNDLNK